MLSDDMPASECERAQPKRRNIQVDDKAIIDLYWERDERAIRETSEKYGKLCTYIANHILSSREDGEECVNDTYLVLWNTIPVQRPDKFSVFIGKITRNLALKKYEYLSAAKRNPSAVTSLEELGECVSGVNRVESEFEGAQIERAINDFLWAQSEEKRKVFIRRYWYFDSVGDICESTGFSAGKVKSMLYHMREKLKKHLEEEGIEI